MTISDMIQRKKELGYSNEKISELSGVPLGTVQKIFSGRTKTPRYATLQSLSLVLEDKNKSFQKNTSNAINMVAEPFTYGIHISDDKQRHNSITSETSMTGKTLDDYLALPEGTRMEMIDGIFYDMASPTVIHQRIALLLGSMFDNFIRKNQGSCLTSIAPTDVQLDGDDKTMVKPDVLVVCDRNKIIKERIIGAPDLIVEILSPSNWQMDMVRKLLKYKHAGVREYWIVLPEHKLIMVYNFEKTTEFKEYTFEEKVPVSIWKNKCKIDFKLIYDNIKFLYE